MGKPEFAHLHVHSDKSMLDGQGLISEYLDILKEDDQRALGITDHGNMISTYDLIRLAREKNVTPVPGIEAYVAPIGEEPFPNEPVFYGEEYQKRDDVSSGGAYTHQTLWAYNEEGLKNLFKLTSLSYDEEKFYKAPRMNFDMIAEHSEGVIIGSGCPSSEISTRFALGQDDKAYEYAYRMKEVFGDRFFIEVMDHNMTIDLERRLLPKQVELAKKLGVELLATTDAHYGRKSDAPHHEELLCAQSGSVMSEKTFDEGGRRMAFSGSEYYLKTAAEMAETFPEDQYPRALSNTLLIAEMAEDLKIDFDPTLKPHPNVPKGYSELGYFKKLVKEGFQKRYGNESLEIKIEARERILHELEVIHSSDFIGYMLTVAEYIGWANNKYSVKHPETNEILMTAIGAGRGSVGGSVIAYCLGISEVEPIRDNLFFARFLSEGRGSIARVTYNDGTSEDLVVSEKKTLVKDGKNLPKYIHELKPGDTIIA